MRSSGIFQQENGNNIFQRHKILKHSLTIIYSGYLTTPHIPQKKTVLSKLNPLQKLVYLGLKVLVIPIMVFSGLLYIFYRYPQKGGGIEALNLDSIEPIALLHTFGAFLLVAFVIAHVYLITTGSTVTSNLKAMITGYEELEEQDKKAIEENPVKIEEEIYETN